MKKLLILTLLLGVSACNDNEENNAETVVRDVVDETQETLQDPMLQGTWLSQCKPTDASNSTLGRSFKTEFTFNGNDFTKAEVFFNDAQCASEETARFRNVGVVDLKDENDLRSMKLQFKNAFLKIADTTMADALGRTNFCGINSFGAGEETEIPLNPTPRTDNRDSIESRSTEETSPAMEGFVMEENDNEGVEGTDSALPPAPRVTDCPLLPKHTTQFLAYEIEDGKLYFASETSGDISNPDNFPRDINTNSTNFFERVN